MIILGVIALIVGNLIPMISKQLMAFANDVPFYYNQTMKFIDQLSDTEQFKWVMTQEYVSISNIVTQLNDYIATLPNRMTNSISGIFSTVTNIAITIVTVPFLLFYMLKMEIGFPSWSESFFLQLIEGRPSKH